MHLLVWTDGFNHIETRHIRETDVSNRQAELAPERMFNSLSARNSGTHTITIVLKNYLEGIGDASLILNEEDLILLLLAF